MKTTGDAEQVVGYDVFRSGSLFLNSELLSSLSRASTLTLAKMKPVKKGCLVTLIAVALISVLLYIPIWSTDAEARRNRDRVNELISVGQNLDEAQRILRTSGFILYHDDPIKPTINKDYFQQLVIVGETQPNTFESFAYASGISWMPFTHSESPYVIINASLDGTITDIE